MRYRQLVTLASEVRWFAVLALLAVLAGLVLAVTHQSIELVGTVGFAAVSLAVLSTREE
jgi:hypothetical protein